SADRRRAARGGRRTGRSLSSVAPGTTLSVPRSRPRAPSPGRTAMKHRLEYAVVRALIGIVRVLPDSVVRAWGSLLGLTFYTIDRAHRRIAERNLAMAFPSRSPGERRAIARAAFLHFGRLLFELLKFSTLSPESMLARVEFDGEERARLAYAQGKGVLFVTGHFGFWELHAIVHAIQIAPIGLLARALDNPHLNQLLKDIREGTDKRR